MMSSLPDASEGGSTERQRGRTGPSGSASGASVSPDASEGGRRDASEGGPDGAVRRLADVSTERQRGRTGLSGSASGPSVSPDATSRSRDFREAGYEPAENASAGPESSGFTSGAYRWRESSFQSVEDPRAAAVVTEAPRILREGEVDHPLVRLDELRGASPRMGLDPEALEAIRRDATTAGYAEGWAEGFRAASAEVRTEAAAAAAAFAEAQQQYAEHIARALAALDDAARQLERRVAEDMHAVEPELAKAAVALAESVLGRELQLTQLPVMDAVRRALDLAPVNRPVIVRLHPDELEAVESALAAAQVEQALGRDISLLPDPAVGQAGCVVECDATRIDAQLGPALNRVWEVLAS